MNLAAGATVNDYRLVHQLGCGSSGEVWKAVEGVNEVAIKFMNPDLIHIESASRHHRRMQSEITALAQLQHPNIPQLYDYDLDFDRPYLVMQIVEGDVFEKMLNDGTMMSVPITKRLSALAQIASALDSVHRQHIIHCDIKPGNICGIDQPFLLDFSVSVCLTDTQQPLVHQAGTSLYAAPDVHPSPYSDIFSFAVTAYELIFGKHPIYAPGERHSPLSIMRSRTHERILSGDWRIPSGIPKSELPYAIQSAELERLDLIFKKAFGITENNFITAADFVSALTEIFIVSAGTQRPPDADSVSTPQSAAKSPHDSFDEERITTEQVNLIIISLALVIIGIITIVGVSVLRA